MSKGKLLISDDFAQKCADWDAAITEARESGDINKLCDIELQLDDAMILYEVTSYKMSQIHRLLQRVQGVRAILKSNGPANTLQIIGKHDNDVGMEGVEH